MSSAFPLAPVRKRPWRVAKKIEKRGGTLRARRPRGVAEHSAFLALLYPSRFERMFYDESPFFGMVSE